MKYFIFLTFAVNLAFAQGANERGSISVLLLKVINTQNSMTYINEDLNSDGKAEVLKGGKIIKIADNEYWIQNTTLTTKNGDVIAFNNMIKKNDSPLIKQAAAENGYILIFDQGVEEVIVYFADVNGNKDSDSISIPID